MPMTLYQQQDLINRRIPFVVRGEAVYYRPGIDSGEPHEWYRRLISEGKIAVEIDFSNQQMESQDDD